MRQQECRSRESAITFASIGSMPAPFAKDLCGYRLDDKGRLTDRPNTSDANSPSSVAYGTRLFDAMGIPKDQPAPKDPGTDTETLMVADLRKHRPDLFIESGKPASAFVQYSHLAVAKHFLSLMKDTDKKLPPVIERMRTWIADREGLDIKGLHRLRLDLGRLTKILESEADARRDFADQLAEESLLKIDLAVGSWASGHDPDLQVAISCKWTFRTDRVQDVVSQGSKIASQKRGRMPHFAAITMEPNPYFLRIPSDGPFVDCVYHLDLPSLKQSLEGATESSQHLFNRLIKQGRLKDYDDLVDYVIGIPRTTVDPTDLIPGA